MPTPDVSSLTQQVLWASFVLSAVFGAIAQRTHFCTMGAVSDIVNIGDWTRMRQWALAAGVAMLGFAGLVFAGWIDPAKTLYASPRWIWLSALVGGALFGFGMVLASGCGSKTLVRIGGGSLKSVIVFVVMGVAAFATLKGITAVLRVDTVDRVAVELATVAALPQLLAPSLGLSLGQASLAIALLVGGLLVVWALRGPEFVCLDNLLAGLGIGAVVVAMWWVSGHLGHVPEHPDTLQEAFLATNSGRIEAMSFVSPVAYTLDWLMFFSDKSKVLTLGIVSVFGVVAGSFAIAVVTRSFRWESFGGTEDVVNHLAGAVLMGVGGVTNMGCTIGQGLSGLSTLSLTSMVALAAILMGAVAAFKYQGWRLDRML
ncbi:YeeE/YedE family protein [Pseudorhodoferax sp. Leaf267]|uniref:YeeE/YedE family protein n=1 Tax=Pseudorhodoferax sp. Leaf267 TaxID=1736316 RepID=UPI0006F44373|nr:YeeE/YedE family protein [Pseudorhodoferax sp. Leaf267]KQP14753.1 transporter [Pseudorhodoferax sp. Leaf267]